MPALANRLLHTNGPSHRGSLTLWHLFHPVRALSRPPEALGTFHFSGFAPQHLKYMEMHPHPILNIIFAAKVFKGFL